MGGHVLDISARNASLLTQLHSRGKERGSGVDEKMQVKHNARIQGALKNIKYCCENLE